MHGVAGWVHGVAGWVHGVAREAVVRLHVHALQQAVHAAAPTHEPTHAPIAAMGAERREPMILARCLGLAVSWALVSLRKHTAQAHGVIMT